MTAEQACDAMEKGIRQVFPTAECIHAPLADGGEGTMRILVDATNGTIFTKTVTGPFGDKVIGEYALLGDGRTAVVELASASGLHLVPLEKRDPMLTTTFGTGELIKEALKHPVEKLIIAIGGSATNDGGAGLLQALGIKLLDKYGRQIGFGGAQLRKLESIDQSQQVVELTNIKIEVACDVNNPLTGINGASVIYAPQKGATPLMVDQLDANLLRYGHIIKSFTGKDVLSLSGAGAAGGTGAGLMAFFKAEFISGIEVVSRYTGLEKKIKKADFIFTGEGSIDRQTVNGKTISGLLWLCKKHGKKIFAFAGKAADHELLEKMGITGIFIIDPGITDLAETLRLGQVNLERTVAQVIKRIC